ncbi:UNVERIFIED_CONTAM: hypothetical protein K2H54_002089 [Gekko kuhli]
MAELEKDALADEELMAAAVSLPPSVPEVDILLHTDMAYYEFWAAARRVLANNLDSTLRDFLVQPLFRGDVRVVTTYMRYAEMPPENLARRLDCDVRVLYGPEEMLDDDDDDDGIGTCEWHTVVHFRRDTAGCIQHLPRYLHIGGERAVNRYSGQPQACYTCNSYRHFRHDCTNIMCSRCNRAGHGEAVCSYTITCSLCGATGHRYRHCPYSVLNADISAEKLSQANVAAQRREQENRQERAAE